MRLWCVFCVKAAEVIRHGAFDVASHWSSKLTQRHGDTLRKRERGIEKRRHIHFALYPSTLTSQFPSPFNLTICSSVDTSTCVMWNPSDVEVTENVVPQGHNASVQNTLLRGLNDDEMQSAWNCVHKSITVQYFVDALLVSTWLFHLQMCSKLF